MKLPAILLYPGDWLQDEIAGCSLAAQGLLLRMMFIGHSSTRYGYLVNPDGSVMHPESIARRCGCTPDQFESLVTELDSVGKLSRTPKGMIFIRRMVRDAAKREDARLRKQKERLQNSVTQESHDCHSDVTIENENKKKSDSVVSSTPLFKQENPVLACEIYDLYPRHVNRRPSIKATTKKIYELARARTAQYTDRHGQLTHVRFENELQAQAFLRESVIEYAASPEGKGHYVPYCSTWMNADRYADDRQEWYRDETSNGNKPNGNGHKTRQQQYTDLLDQCFSKHPVS